MAAEIEAAFPGKSEIELVKGDNGAFEVTVGDKRVYSKLSNGRFPAYQEIPKLLLEF